MDEPSTSSAGDMALCQLCNTKSRVYTCPRCGIGYCSVDCYKSEMHLECSESFYKECVEEELKSQENDPDARRRMVDILKRIHDVDLSDIFEDDADENNSELDSDDDADYLDLEERLHNVDLDNPNEIWSVLTDNEKKEFECLVKSGKVEKLIPQWTPWWTFGTKKILIQELDADEQNNHDYLKGCPALVNVPQFNELQKASPQIYFNLQNVIYAYVYTALYFNGDYMNCIKEAAGVFLDICDNMRENKIFNESVEAKESVLQRIISCNHVVEDNEILSRFEEGGISILQGPTERNDALYVSAALSEIHKLLTAAREEISQQKTKSTNSDFSRKFQRSSNLDEVTLSKKTLLLCLKKIEYYLSWVKTYGYIYRTS